MSKTFNLKFQLGISLIEVLITIAVLITLLSLALPSFKNTLDERTITAAAENIFADIALARSEAIKQNTAVSVVFEASTATAWSYGLDDTPATVCAGASASPTVCTINTQERVTNGSKFENVTMSTGDLTVTFDGRGWANATQAITVDMTGQTSRTININQIGRIQFN